TGFVPGHSPKYPRLSFQPTPFVITEVQQMKDQSKTKQARSESERRKVELALKESKESGWTILENIQEGYYEVDLSGNYTFFNSFMSKILGYTKEEMMGMNYRLYMDKETSKKIFRYFNEVYQTGISSKVDYEQINKDGSIIYVETSVALMRDSFGQPTGFRGIVRDITERKRTEEALQRAHDELEQRVADRTEELMQVNEELRIEITEHKQAEDNIKQQTDATEAAIDGMALLNEDGKYIYLNKAHVKIYGYENAGELIGKSWRIIYDADEVKRVEAEIMPKLRQKGYWQGEALGMKKNGNKFPQELSLTALDSGGLICIVSDITERKRAEQKLQDTLDSLRKAFSAIVQVMVSAVEIRDPYTAGHQMRSADLARAIAAEMNLSQDKIEAIRMAGSIHDIGKLSIPAEILSKPKKLSEIEISLIKEHSRNGYEMLKDVESPWPLAEIVYQHHERMDGSGYPRNLKGEEILIEARILAVADVVGAMASHRPYRPALGLNAALAEIENNKGTLYDADAVDACLRLFREKGFQLEGT
ncbi:MAG TPA: HD domain-containing phosphohydrolase, partial [Syntrophales bacterium]